MCSCRIHCDAAITSSSSAKKCRIGMPTGSELGCGGNGSSCMSFCCADILWLCISHFARLASIELGCATSDLCHLGPASHGAAVELCQRLRSDYGRCVSSIPATSAICIPHRFACGTARSGAGLPAKCCEQSPGNRPAWCATGCRPCLATACGAILGTTSPGLAVDLC